MVDNLMEKLIKYSPDFVSDYRRDSINRMTVWTGFIDLLHDAIQANNQQLVKEIFDLSKQDLECVNCDADPALDPYTSVIRGFFTDLLRIKNIEKHINEHFTKEEL